MTYHNINLQIRIGNLKAPILQTESVKPIKDIVLDAYGTYYGETEILHLGSHLNKYIVSSFHDINRNRPTNPHHVLGIPGSTKIPTHKKAAPSVSGNLGEVLTCYALEDIAKSSIAINSISALKSGAIRCPDFIVETRPLTAALSYLPRLPDYIPCECKNNDFLEALRQLASYWKELPYPHPSFGYGIISSLDYSGSITLKFNFITPILSKINDFNVLLNSIDSVKEINQKDLGGYLNEFK